MRRTKLLATVLSSPEIHLQGCLGYELTGTTVAFDGTEDWMISRDARIFWDELNMRERIDNELQRLQQRHHAKELIWNFENVQREIIRYPKRGKHDAEPEGMEDEPADSVDGESEKHWEENSDAEEDASVVAEDLEGDREPDLFDPEDWVNPEEAVQMYACSEEDFRCRGDKAHHTNSRLSLPGAQETGLVEYQTRMRAYKDCLENLKSLRTPISYSLAQTVERTLWHEKKTHASTMQ